MTAAPRVSKGKEDAPEAMLEQLVRDGVDVADLERRVAEATKTAYAGMSQLPLDDISVAVALLPPSVTLSNARGEAIIITPEESHQLSRVVVATIRDWRRTVAHNDLARLLSVRRNELVVGVVNHPVGAGWILTCPEFECLLPTAEQMPGEELHPGDHLAVVVVDLRARMGGSTVVVSRIHPGLVRCVVEDEVPEVASGTVTIEAVAREPGRRAKAAVKSHDPSVDPQGACIGPKGIRHHAMAARLGSEQVQFVLFDTDPAVFIGNALAPVIPRAVVLSDDGQHATVRVAADDLPSAIGRGGENVRLAARLTGWHIDIVKDGSDVEPPLQDDPEPAEA